MTVYSNKFLCQPQFIQTVSKTLQIKTNCAIIICSSHHRRSSEEPNYTQPTKNRQQLSAKILPIKYHPIVLARYFFINLPPCFLIVKQCVEQYSTKAVWKRFQTAFTIISICNAIPGKNTQNSLCSSAHYGQFQRTLRFNFTIRLFCVISHFCSRNFFKLLALLLQIHYISLHKEQTLGKAKYTKA